MFTSEVKLRGNLSASRPFYANLRRALVAGAVSALTGIFAAAPAMAQNVAECRDALVMSTYSQMGAYQSDARMSVIVDEKTWSEANRTFGANAILYDVPIGATFNAYQNSASQRRLEYGSSLKVEEALNITWTKLEPNGLSAYQACIDALTSANGLRMTPAGGTAEQIIVKVRYVVVGSQPNPISVKWSGLGAETAKLPTEINAGTNLFVVPRPTEEKVIIIHSPGMDESVTLTPLKVAAVPPPPPTLHIYVGACKMFNVLLWGPVGEPCGNQPGWGTYSLPLYSGLITALGTCVGQGPLAGLLLYGPFGEACAGDVNWGTYQAKRDLSNGGMSSCLGVGSVAGIRFWGSTGASCEAIGGPGATFSANTRMPQRY